MLCFVFDFYIYDFYVYKKFYFIAGKYNTTDIEVDFLDSTKKKEKKFILAEIKFMPSSYLPRIIN